MVSLMERLNLSLLSGRRALSSPSLRCSNKGQNHERNKAPSPPYRLLFATFVITLSNWLQPVAALDIKYCSNLNTGDDFEPASSIYQSNGLCLQTCTKGSYAFAVVQGFNCWCSNYIPGATTAGCDEKCPGYPDDKCGNTDESLFGYIPLPNKPLGTKGGDSSTTEKEKPTSQSSSNTAETTKAESIESHTSPKRPQITPPPTYSPDPKSKPHSRVQSVTVVTTIGGFKTIILTPSTIPAPLPSAEPSSEPSPEPDSFMSKPGRVAGLVVGLLLLLLLLVGAIFLRRHRNRQLAALSRTSTPHSGVIPAGGSGLFGRQRSRSLSTLGLIAEKGMSSRDTSPADTQNFASNDITGMQTPMVGQVYDQRLDPAQVYLRFDPQTGSSRMSVRSLRDDQDYSRRVLRLANPDD